MESEGKEMSSRCLINLSSQLNKCEDLSQFSDYEDFTYKIFLTLYENNSLFYEGKNVLMKHYPPEYNPRSGFYHLTCENYSHTNNENDRVPNLKRYERIKWPKIIIDNLKKECPYLYIWKNVRYGKKNILIMCLELEYIIVLSERNDYLLLTTAYPIEYEHTLRKLIKEYNEYKKQETLSDND